MYKRHEIKCLSNYFEQVWQGMKGFELRKNDRDYCIGDIVELHEIDANENYTDRVVTVVITYVLKDCHQYGLQDGFCIFGWNPALCERITHGNR